jgi:hypothetical protein
MNLTFKRHLKPEPAPPLSQGPRAPQNKRVIPFHAKLETPLLAFGNEKWTIRDACESVSVLGAIGSGKTSSTMKLILEAYLRAGFGGLYLVAKVDAADELRKAMKAAGRSEKDLVYFRVGEGSAMLNLLDYAMRQFASGGFDQSLLAFLAVMIEAGRKASGTGGGDKGENKFFTEAALKIASHVFVVLRVAYGTIRLKDVYAFVTSMPETEEEEKSAAWRNTSFCGQTLRLLGRRLGEAEKAGTPDAPLQEVWDDHCRFFTGEVAKLHPKTKHNVVASLTNSLYPFMSGALHTLFATDTTEDATPQAAREGRVIVAELPALQYGAGAVIAQTLLKYLFGMAWQSEKVTDETRPCFIFVDEAQAFVSVTDNELIATARSVRVSYVLVSQDLPTYYARVGADGKDAINGLLAKAGTKLYHANTCATTNSAAAEMIGKVEKWHRSESRSYGTNSGGGGARHDASGGYNAHTGANQGTGESTSGYMDFDIPPEYFATQLRTGGPRNKGMVDAILIRTGRNFKETGKHFLKVEFKQ